MPDEAAAAVPGLTFSSDDPERHCGRLDEIEREVHRRVLVTACGHDARPRQAYVYALSARPAQPE